MKKGMIAALACAVVLGLAGCGGDKFGALRAGYEKTSESLKIEQTIEVKDGTLVVYGSEKEYTRSEGKYTVKTTEKRLNEVGAEEAYTTEEKTETAERAERFDGTLTLEAEYFTEFTVTEKGLTAEVKDGCADELFGLKGEHAEIKDMTLELKLDGEELVSLLTTFSSKEYTVTVRISFTY